MAAASVLILAFSRCEGEEKIKLLSNLEQEQPVVGEGVAFFAAHSVVEIATQATGQFHCVGALHCATAKPAGNHPTGASAVGPVIAVVKPVLGGRRANSESFRVGPAKLPTALFDFPTVSRTYLCLRQDCRYFI